MKKLLTWLKKPNPDTTLVNWWKRKRVRDRQRAEEKCRAKIRQEIKALEQYRESIKKEAYFLWEANGKQEGKDDYYWTKAIEKITGKNVSFIYKPDYLLESDVMTKDMEPESLQISGIQSPSTAPVERRAKTASHLAYIVVFTFALGILICFIFSFTAFFSPSSKIESENGSATLVFERDISQGFDMFKAFSAIMSGPLGFVLGFYFRETEGDS